MPRLDETRPFLPVNIALLTVSDTRDAAQDRSGNTLADLATTASSGADVANCRSHMTPLRCKVQIQRFQLRGSHCCRPPKARFRVLIHGLGAGVHDTRHRIGANKFAQRPRQVHASASPMTDPWGFGG